MRRSLLRTVVLFAAICWLSGCCIYSIWSSANQALNFDLGKIGTGDQAAYAPNSGQPWQGDAVEKKMGF
jgi:hypothetical protein